MKKIFLILFSLYICMNVYSQSADLYDVNFDTPTNIPPYDESTQVFQDIYVTASVSHLIEISHENSGKHKAMLKLMNILGIPLDQVIAFGDGDNDSEMLSVAGLGIAVSNASPLCKEAADLIIGESRNEAIADFLIDFFHISD